MDIIKTFERLTKQLHGSDLTIEKLVDFLTVGVIIVFTAASLGSLLPQIIANKGGRS